MEKQPVETHRVLWTAEPGGEELVPVEPIHKPSVLKRAGAALKSRWPRFDDERQRRAGRNILRFLAAMLVLTIAARGTAAATLPVVSTEAPGSGEIIESVRGNGTVRGAGTQSLSVPEGLTVEEVPVSAGQAVETGTPLVKFDEGKLADAIARKGNEAREFELKLKTLTQTTPYDGSALADAERALTWARQDYDSTKAAGDAAVQDAQNALNDANAAAQAANDALAALPPDAEEEERAAAQTAANEATARAAEAADALQRAQSDAQATLQGKAREIETAQIALDKAKTADANGRREDANTRAQGSIDADNARLDAERAREQLEKLQKIQRDGGYLLAEGPGTVVDVPTAGSETSAAPLVNLSTSASGYLADAYFSAEEAEGMAAGGTVQVSEGSASPYANSVVEGVIQSVQEDAESGRVKVTLKLPEGSWKQGQSLQLRVVQSRQTYPQCVPVSALRANGVGYYVLVPETREGVWGTETRLVQVPVTVLAKDDTSAAIQESFAPGDRVVVDSEKPVEPGNTVRVADE